MNLAHRVLHSLGATQVFKTEAFEDPQTEEEFKKIQYTSNVEITWEQYKNKYAETELKFGLKILRSVRSELLRNTDWVMTSDNYASLSNKQEWVAYRQALRDLPENPPKFKWKNTTLDVESMDMPVQPPIMRLT
jgi:hypothetical protein